MKVSHFIKGLVLAASVVSCSKPSEEALAVFKNEGDTITVNNDKYLKTEDGRYGLYVDNSSDVLVSQINDTDVGTGDDPALWNLSQISKHREYKTSGGDYNPRDRVYLARVAPLR